MRPRMFQILFACLLVFINAHLISAQTTTFTYQGKLTDNGNPASSNYDLQFTLWDTLGGGIQQPQPSPITVTRNNVAVIGGGFTVQLDFTVNAFPGADRFLEIGVRPAGGGAFTILSPRQQISSTPYAIRTLSAMTAETAANATQLGGVPANQYVQTNDARLSDARTPTPGSSDYIQSNPASAQTGANFNISGNGTAGGTFSGTVINTTTQYNLGGNRILSVQGTLNMFAGIGAGQANTSGQHNAFFGTEAGFSNTSGTSNTFFGSRAGRNNASIGGNSFFGDEAGFFNTGGGNSYFGASAGEGGFGGASGGSNSFFGYLSGQFNTTGGNNSFFGTNAGQFSTGNNNAFFGYRAGLNDSIGQNSFFGSGAGQNNSSGQANSFFGYQAGSANVTGSTNSFFGYLAGQSNTSQQNNTFIGGSAGQTNGTNDTTNSASFNTFVGSVAGARNTTGGSNSFFGASVGAFNTSGFQNSFFGVTAGENNTTAHDNTFIGYRGGVDNGIGDTNPPNANYNTFVGSFAGETNRTGRSNTVIGALADVSANNFTNATAIGANATVSENNALVLGSINNINGGTSDTNVGIGTTTPGYKLHIAGHTTHDWPIIKLQNIDSGGHSYWLYAGARAVPADFGIYDETAGSYSMLLTNSGNIAIGAGASVGTGVTDAIAIGTAVTVNSSNTIVIGGESDFVRVGKLSPTLAGFSDSPLCRDNQGFIGTCGSSLRYKTGVQTYSGGMKIVDRLLPITFTWKNDHTRSLGLAAEDVAAVEPLLVTHNDQGEIDGVKYAQLSAVFINALKEQQAEARKQQTEILMLRSEVRRLRARLPRHRRPAHR